MIETSSAIATERVIDVREITPRVRHTVVLQLFEHLDEARSLQLVVDHDPRPLRLQLEAKHGSRCGWTDPSRAPTFGAFDSKLTARSLSRVRRPVAARRGGDNVSRQPRRLSAPTPSGAVDRRLGHLIGVRRSPPRNATRAPAQAV